MRTLLLTFLLMVGYPVGVQSASTDWAVALDKIERKVLRVEMASPSWTGVCSGVVLNAEKGFLLTAAHCVDDENVQLTVDQRHAEVVRVNRVLDLAVIRFSPRPEQLSVKLAAAPPNMGREVAVVGFAFGEEQIHAQFGYAARRVSEGETWMDVTVIPGDSGGAVLNAKGELVGITSAVVYDGPSHLGVVIALETLRDFVQQYLPTTGTK